MTRSEDPRRVLLLEFYRRGLEAVDGRRRMRAALAGREPGPVHVLAAGKAAAAMALGALDALGAHVLRALVVSRADYFDPLLERHPDIRCMQGGHPLPDSRSLEAGAAALEFAAATPPGARVLLLVSGGASSLLEVLPPGLTLSQLRQVNEWAMTHGVEIDALNRARRTLSGLKDGRLVAAFDHCRTEGYFISDVPGDDPAVVGSGLLAPATGPVDLTGLPDWIARLAGRMRLPPGRAAGQLECVGRVEDALAAVERAAVGCGLSVALLHGRLRGDAVAAAVSFAHGLAMGSSELLVGGGETTVRLPEHPGRGGRNQHLALAAARQLAGYPDLLMLAAGTDGSDGNTDDAGALVDGDTVARGAEAGMDASACLEGADSGTFLEATGDLVHTGATGTNVGDLVLGLRREPGHSRELTPSM